MANSIPYSHTSIPYSHTSISSLAKHLRESMQSEHGASIGQSQMLQMLARAAGHKNYQSLKAHSEVQIENDKLPILVSTTPEHVFEIFDRTQDGRILDRRNEIATRVTALVSVTLKIGKAKATFRLKIWSYTENIPDPALKEPLNQSFAEATIRYLTHPDHALDLFSILAAKGETEIEVTPAFQFSNKSDGPLAAQIWLSGPAMERLKGVIKEANPATATYCDHIFYLRDFVRTGVDIEGGRATRAMEYIQQVEESVSRPGHHYSWYWENFPRIKRVVTRILNGQDPIDHERKSAYRDLSTVNPGTVWTRQPSA